jgi:uncharacterized membrane protein
MPIACPQCQTEMPDEAAFCPRCGIRMIGTPSAVGPTGLLKENIVGALAYVTFFPAIFFLIRKPFKTNQFVRFHSWQSIYLAIGTLLAGVVLRIAFYLLSLIPHGGQLLAWLALIVISLGWLILWLLVLVKALQGVLFKLPGIGHFAERV